MMTGMASTKRGPRMFLMKTDTQGIFMWKWENSGEMDAGFALARAGDAAVYVGGGQPNGDGDISIARVELKK